MERERFQDRTDEGAQARPIFPAAGTRRRREGSRPSGAGGCRERGILVVEGDGNADVTGFRCGPGHPIVPGR